MRLSVYFVYIFSSSVPIIPVYMTLRVSQDYYNLQFPDLPEGDKTLSTGNPNTQVARWISPRIGKISLGSQTLQFAIFR